MASRKEVVLVTTTVILTSLAFIIYMAFFQTSPTFQFVTSERITWERAKELKGEYKDFKPMKVRHKGRSGNDEAKTEELEGFVLEAAHLKEIIDKNLSGEIPDKIIFYFGKDGEFGFPGFKNANLHIVAVGIKGGKLLNFNPLPGSRADDVSVFDKADPCPPFCPE